MRNDGPSSLKQASTLEDLRALALVTVADDGEEGVASVGTPNVGL